MNENLNEILSDVSDFDSSLITVAADIESSLIISVTWQQLIIIFSKVSCSDLSFIMQRKCDKKIKKFANNLNSDSDHIFWKWKHHHYFFSESLISVSLMTDYESENLIQQWQNELIKLLE